MCVEREREREREKEKERERKRGKEKERESYVHWYVNFVERSKIDCGDIPMLKTN